MLNIKSFNSNILIWTTMILTLLFVACSEDNGPSGPEGSTAKVAGRISTTSSSPKYLGKTGSAESSVTSVQGAVVILAQVQADGSLKTVSTQSVETDVNGKFVVETKLNDVKNLIVVAEQGTIKWKAVVSSKVKNGTTVYAPPLNEESSTEADIYIKVVSSGHANDVAESDLKVLLDADAAAKIYGNTNAETQFINAVQVKSQVTAQSAGNAYFGFSTAQIQAMTNAKAEACAKLDEELYMSGDSESEIETRHKNYESAVISTCANSNVSAHAYLKLMRIGLTAYANASSSLDTEARFALVKNCYKRYAFTLSYTMSQQFQATGATSAQLNAVSTAGTSLYASIKSSASMNQINDAFVQYHSAIKAQLKAALNSHTTQIDTLDATINTSGSAKTVLTAVLNTGASLSVIINAYVTFYNTINTSTQTALTGASSAQVNAASQILILANMN